MRLSKTAKDKWLAACLFSATVLAGFQLQRMDAYAGQPETTTTVTSTPANGSASAERPGSFATSTNSVTLSSSSSSSTSTSSNSSSASSTSTTQTTSTTSTSSTSTSTTTTSSSHSSTTVITSSTNSNSSSSSSSSTNTGSNNNTGNGTTETEPMGNLLVNAFDGLTHSKIETSNYQGAVDSSIKDKDALVAQIPGYSYVGDVNSDIPSTYEKDPQTANLVYMPLSSIVVRYVDVTDPDKVLWTYTIPTNYATEGQKYTTDTNVIPFTGYDFDYASANTSGTIDQTVKSLKDSNPITVSYYYKPEPNQNSTWDTSNWIVTTATTPIGSTGEYSFNVSVKRNNLPAMQLGGYGIGQTGPVHAHTNTGSTGSSITTNTGTSENSSTATTDTNIATTTDSNTASTVAAPTATVNIINESGKPAGQMTVSGQPGTNVRAQIQQQLNDMRQNGTVILSNGVKGNTALGTTDSVLTIKISNARKQLNPFQNNTMPIVIQLGNASQSVRQENNATTNKSSNQDSNTNNSQTSQSNSQKKQRIAQTHNSAQATSKDTEQNAQTSRDAIANNGQSLHQFAADNGGGGSHVTQLGAYFISLSGKINLGSRV
ncbi:hypothetical protein HC026_03895 [Lactobacillus sp. LC28-10]|uniref:Uncharacterized protein n=1 Tax=Secundilactobacillus angelensis TaxID=2722706 RepID=A0ABX1KWT5_9LACO|nr:hypothetical protein [Secundilactobacillus angelensis]MCH5462454.1 hypothetical protein [Secundilactobacillus angelensis]NLR18064.1 hypothetical protein [Secundilactobacillus angelensis]